ncbi:MAG: pilin, partial [Candidatus Gracilibacteria bacterium]
MKRIKKILIALVIAALAANFLVAIGNVGNAGFGTDAGRFIGGLFGGDESGNLSFTSYEGGLAELSSEGYDSSLTTSSDLKEFILRVVNFALGFLGLIAVLIVIYAGVSYVISNGEDEKTGKAKKMIGYAAVGLLIVMGSFAFVNTVIKSALVGGNTGGGTGVFGRNYGRGFNAISEEVKGIALDVYQGYVFLADTTEEFKNINTDLEKASLQEASLPTKATVANFLFEVKSSLSEVKLAAGQLTEVESAINDKMRSIEAEADKL